MSKCGGKKNLNNLSLMVTMIPIIGVKVLSSNILGPVSFRILKNNRLIIGSIIIIDNNVTIPAQTLRIYDEDGEFVSYRNHQTSGIDNNNDEDNSNDDLGNQYEILFEFCPIKNSSQQAFSSTPTTDCPTTSTPLKENEPSARRQLTLNEPQTKEINCAITQPTSVSRKYNSTYAGLLADIFGDDPRFARYDVLHTEIKSKQGKVSMSYYKEYKDILAEITH